MQSATIAKIQASSITGLSLVCAYALAFYWQLDKPFWAGFTVFMVSLPSIGQSLQKGLLRIVGTFIGAAIGLLLFMLFPHERFMLLFFLSLYLCIMMYFMAGSRFYGYFFFITALVTMIIILIGSENPSTIFNLAVYRSEETLLGIAVYTIITLIVEPRLSLETFTGNMETLMRAHLELFLQAREQEQKGVLHTMYARYVAILDLINATELLLPAVKLENHQIYTDRALWRSALAYSAELFETQRKWTGTLVAMKKLDLEGLFPDFADRLTALEQVFRRLPDPGAPIPSTLPVLDYSDVPFFALSATERGLVTTARALYRRQTRLCSVLYRLMDYLLRGGKRPSDIDNAPPRQMFFFRPEQRSSMVQAFVLFWITAIVWILFDPPGTGSISFMELTVLLGLTALLTGNDKPLSFILYFVYGIALTGVFYIFVYPLVTDFLLFLVLMFAIGFSVSFWLSRADQRAQKFGFMLPWLAVCNFTNTPVYSFLSFATSSLTLLLGISLVSCIRYVLFLRDEDSAFMHKQMEFFHAAKKLLRLMREYHGRDATLFHTFFLSFSLHRVHFLAAQIDIKAKKIARPFMAPEIARILGTEIMDIASSLHRLHVELKLSRVSLPRLSVQPSSGYGVVAQADALRHMTDAILDDLYTDSSALSESSSATHENTVLNARHRMEVSCGSIVKSLSGYVDVVRSLPEKAF